MAKVSRKSEFDFKKMSYTLNWNKDFFSDLFISTMDITNKKFYERDAILVQTFQTCKEKKEWK